MPSKASLKRARQKYTKTLKGRLHHSVDKARGRAKVDGVPCTIKASEIVVPEKCPILGLELEWGVGKGTEPNTPSLDRLVASKGYVPENINVISWRANSLKSDAELWEIMKLSRWMIEKLVKIDVTFGEQSEG